MRQLYIAVDQYGDTIHGIIHPRKEIMQRHNTQHCEKMYTDKKDGSIVTIGYIVRGHWYTVYKIKRMERKQ